MEEEILVLTFLDGKNTERILDKYLDVAPGGKVAFHNNYFNISIGLTVLSNPELDATLRDDSKRVGLARFPAIVVLSSSDSSAIYGSQKMWENIHSTVCKDAVRILFLDGDNLDEKETYQLVAWGLEKQIEVVNSLLCKEDGVDITVRLKRILECSPWSSISCSESRLQKEDRELNRNDTTNGEIREASSDDFKLSRPTCLRRGLNEGDVTRLVNDLLLADDSDSDG